MRQTTACGDCGGNGRRRAGGRRARRVAGTAERPLDRAGTSGLAERDADGSTVQAASVAQRPVLFARVVKPFGASIRALPSSDAAYCSTPRCGDTWPVLTVERGWVKVRTEAGSGWIGGSRVVVSTTPPTVDCSDARFIAPNGYVRRSCRSGCLSLRSRPSATTPRRWTASRTGTSTPSLDGPFDPGSGDDWFRVTSPSTGSGWVPAEHLYPI